MSPSSNSDAALRNGHPGTEQPNTKHRANGRRRGPSARVEGQAPVVARVDKVELERHVREILRLVGEDPERDGLHRTPHRVAKMYDELLAGYGQDVETILNGAMFDVDYGESDMVVVSGIEYQSLCEHHMLPFTGTAHVAYLPRERVVGLSKIPRIVDMFAKRLQVQERLTNQIADAIDEALDPLGVFVLVDGQHSCASLRGVKKHGMNMATTARRGRFAEDPTLRDEFFRMVER